MKSEKKNIEIKQLRSFGLLVGGIFLVIGLWPVIFRDDAPRVWALILATVLVIPALIFPASLSPIYKGWMVIGNILGWINTRIILSVVFFGLFMPMGIVMRFMGKDPLRRKFDSEADTYRIVRNLRPPNHLRRQF